MFSLLLLLVGTCYSAHVFIPTYFITCFTIGVLWENSLLCSHQFSLRLLSLPKRYFLIKCTIYIVLLSISVINIDFCVSYEEPLYSVFCLSFILSFKRFSEHHILKASFFFAFSFYVHVTSLHSGTFRPKVSRYEFSSV